MTIAALRRSLSQLVHEMGYAGLVLLFDEGDRRVSIGSSRTEKVACDNLREVIDRFTEIQALAVEPLLAGENCMLVSPTASGKTEAALMPLIERIKRNSKTEPQNSLQLIYMVPTRALDRRLRQPLEQLAISMQIKTGDEPALKPNRPPQLLLTTPESFDSLLANRPRMLKDVRAVVLDEIHLLDNTARGDQLRVLLNRLRRLRG